MNVSRLAIVDRLRRLSPTAIFTLGLLYELVLEAIDVVTPTGMSFTLFYLLGIAFVGWGAGTRPAALLSLVAVALIEAHDWRWPRTAQVTSGIALWNASTRFLLLAGAGWLTAEVTRLTRMLGMLVERRTAQWKAEAEQHRATSAQLADTLELNQKILAASAMGIVAYKASGECVFVNEALARIAGGTPDEILKGNYRQLTGWQRSGLLRLATEALEQKKTGSGEFCDTTRFGKTVWVDAHMAPFVSGGEPHLLGMFYDITERKRSELLLRVQRDVGVNLSLTSDLTAALKSLIDVALQLEGIDCGGAYLADPKTGELRLATHRGTVSQSFLDQMSSFPANSERARVVAKGQPLYHSYDERASWRTSTQEREGLRAVAVVPLCHEARAVGALNFGTHTNDSIPPQSRVIMEAIAAQAAGAIARIRTENALLESQQRLRAIITSVPIILFAVDQNGVITLEDGQALRAIGAAAGQHVGQPLAEAYSDFPAILEHVGRGLAGQDFSGKVPVGPLMFDCWYSPMRDRDGQIKGVMGVAADVTDRHRLERQILDISDREQARLGQEIHDGLCQQLVSLAFDANALDRQLTQAGRSEAATARRIADFLDEAITGARQLSRGLFPIRLEVEGLASALQELAKSTQERFHITCRFEYGERLPITNRSDATHLYRIAQEAVNNAVKHGRAAAVSIRLHSRDGQIKLEVEDDGAGLQATPPAALAGMGLHIMEYRARSMGGTVRLDPGPRGGALLVCVIPGPPSA